MFGPHSNVIIVLRKSKFDFQPYLERQNRISNIKTHYLVPILISKLDIECKKFDIRSLFECQNRISTFKIRYSVLIRKSKLDFECQNAILGASSFTDILLAVVAYFTNMAGFQATFTSLFIHFAGC